MKSSNQFRDQLMYLLERGHTHRECRAELRFMHSVAASSLAELYMSGKIDETQFANMSVDLAHDLREAQSFLCCKFGYLRI